MLNLIVLIIISSWHGAYADEIIYKIVTPKKNIVFTDQPDYSLVEGESVSKISLSSPNILHIKEEYDKQKNTNTVQNKNFQSYEFVSIKEPASDASFWNQSAVTVIAEVMPALTSDHAIRLLVNGEKRIDDNQTGQFNLANLTRGSYSIQPIIVNKEGEKILIGESISIYIHLFSKLFKKNQ